MRRAALAYLTAIAVAACGGASSDQAPPEAADPSRIVSLAGNITEVLFAIGAGDQVVGVDVTTVYPEEAAQLPIVGLGRFLTAEGVLAQQPTLVIGDTQTAPQSAIDQIRAAGVDVVILPIATTFDALYDKVRSIGTLVGREAEADDLAGRMQEEIDAAAAEAAARSERPRIAYLYVRGPDARLLFGSGMTTQPVIEAANAIDAGAGIGIVETVPITAEALVEAAPDVIVTPSEGLEITGGIDGLLEIPGVAQTPAGRNRAVLDYPEGDFLTFGPRIAESLRLLIADLEDILGP